MINVEEKKLQIAGIIRDRGPMLPIHVAREIKMETIFTSAIMSEMISNKMLRVSNLKVGGSPLYLLPGQESLLENFVNYLPEKEKEAFLLLKKRGILEDDKLQPAYRVALRSIRDFAIPIKIDSDGEKIFWRINSLPKEEAVKMLNELMKRKKERIEPKPEIKREEKIEVAKKEKPTGTNFEKRIYEYLKEKGIDILGEIYKKKKEVSLRISVNSNIGKIEMILIAKDKKSINETDLSLAYHRGQTAKTPVLFLVNGSINKKMLKEIENFKSYVLLRQFT